MSFQEYVKLHPMRVGLLLVVSCAVGLPLMRTCDETFSLRAEQSVPAVNQSSVDEDNAVTSKIHSEMQRWINHHPGADQDDAEAMEALLDLRDTPEPNTNLIVVDRAYRTGDAYCMYLRHASKGGNLMKDRAYLDDVEGGGIDGGKNALIIVESEMSPDAKVAREFASNWNMRCRTGAVVKDTTAYFRTITTEKSDF